MANQGSRKKIRKSRYWTRPLSWEEFNDAWDFAFRNFRESHASFIDLLESSFRESDRGCVLVAATIVDEELERLLRTFFALRSQATQSESDFFFKGVLPPLQSTALKIRMATALGLIERRVAKSLVALQRLRSQVAAHSRSRMRLTKDDIVAICDDPNLTAAVESDMRHALVFAVTSLIEKIDSARKSLN